MTSEEARAETLMAGRMFRVVPLPLGLVIFLAQVAIGILLFAVFQEYVPRELRAGD